MTWRTHELLTIGGLLGLIPAWLLIPNSFEIILMIFAGWLIFYAIFSSLDDLWKQKNGGVNENRN